LVDLDPGRAAIYRANAKEATERLMRLEVDLAAILNPVKERSFIVFHDAYQYLEQRYDLTVAGSITVAADRKPGAKRLREIQDRLANAGVACVFAEPQFPPDVVATVIEGTGARAGVADPLGASLEPGSDLYPALMRGLAQSLAECLSPHS
jgi:zinc transport system substrate-binding protein